MKNLCFALCGITLLCMFSFCSVEETEFEETAKETEREEISSGDTPSAGEPEHFPPDEDDEVQADNTPKLPPVYKDPNAPVLQINELRTEYNSGQARAEFIEFRANAVVNLDGMRVFIASNNRNPLVYEFSSVEIGEYEYVVLHLRTLDASSKDEYGENLNESGGRDASPTARDFWVPGNTKLLRKTDIVYVLDRDDNVVDAVMIAEKPEQEWPRDYFTETAAFLFNQGAWKSAEGTFPVPADAVDSSGIKTSLTRSISRDETTAFTRTAADWYITAIGGVTPGMRNSPRP